MAQLGRRLESIPEKIATTTRFQIGHFRGLLFGLLLYTHFHPEVFLEGATTRTSAVSSKQPGPRAVMNALERLAGSYAQDVTATSERLVLAEGQLRDYEARRGKPFPDDTYLTELERVRDALRDALSGRQQTKQDEQQISASDVAEQIKQLLAGRATETHARAPRKSVSTR